jgi:hypothetical protein
MRVTHERIVVMLGVRREGVTEAAIQLQREGLIRYNRGRIEVLDRCGLKQHSCECYDVVQRAYEHLYSGSSAWRRAFSESKWASASDGRRIAKLRSPAHSARANRGAREMFGSTAGHR